MPDLQKTSQLTMISGIFGLIIARLVSPLVSFVIIVLVARFWGRDILGQYNTVWVWLTLFQYLSLFGLGEYISREIGANRSEAGKYQIHGLIFGFVSSLLCASIMIGGAVLFKYPDEVKYGIMITSLALPFNACTCVCQAIFTAFRKIKYSLLTSIFENSFFLLMACFVIFKGYGLIVLIGTLVSGRLLGSILNLFILRHYNGRLNFKIDWAFYLKLLTPVVIFGVTGVASQIFLRIDIVMLSWMKEMMTVGLYSSASKLMQFCLILPLSFYLLNLPIAARGYQKLGESAHQQTEANTRPLFVLVFFVFGVGFSFAEAILGLIYGKPFVEAGWTLKILMAAFLVMSAETVLTMSCQAGGYQKVAMYVAITRTIFCISLNYFLIPAWGAEGAALSTLLSISLSFAILQYFMKRTLGALPWISIIRKPALICLIMMFFSFLLKDRLNLLLLGFLFFSGYFFSFLALNGFSLGSLKNIEA
jgi:O-antigen/teichoic acid export membrane protein